MKKFLTYSILVFALAFGAITSAYAGPTPPGHPAGPPPAPPPPPPPPPPSRPGTAPEVDPSLAIGGFSLLAGTLTVLRARRRK
ncbi:MAG: hypothetical protein WBX22_19990 [Silvibacterium sp.]